ncbi:DUF5133 domain-containing protein [Streptomyces sp. NPDC057363]|uniref:DUF5133 domain-containing protein n=1 Tax=Streptomyces sp. NPDC057363 TaxID=3346107 RepID=UPI00364538F3
MAHPAVLRNLLEQYEALTALNASKAVDHEMRQRMDDVAYTLCVSTATRDLDAALMVARRQVSGVRDDDQALADA